MKIATMATGGIGGFLAARLVKSGHEVATIARGAHLAAIKENGLTLEAFDGTVTVTPWKVTDDPAEVGPVDAIIFGIKANRVGITPEGLLKFADIAVRHPFLVPVRCRQC